MSRRIRDEDTRAALTDLATAAMAGRPGSLGLILRSACEAADEDEIAADITAMADLAQAVLADLDGGPELLVEGAGAHDVAWRDWSDPDPDEVVEGGFESSGITDLIAPLTEPRVGLSGGGHAMIEVTRALIAVDVNTGPDTSPAAALKANIALARDLPRQLRLRGLGGQIVIDFAPMPKKDRAILDQVIKAAFKPDGADTVLVGWTTLGLYEMTRKRDRLPLSDMLD